MSKAVEAATKAVGDHHVANHRVSTYEGLAIAALEGALPHLVEGLAEVIHERIFGYDDYGVANDDERAEMEAHATVIADELKRRIEA